MAKIKKAVVVSNEEVKKAEVESVVETKDSVTVSWRGRSREYSKELHGKEFKKLAEEFATKVGGKLV